MSPEDSVITHDMESNNWRLISKSCNAASEPIPWNLVFHSVFKLNHQNLCVLWYDIVIGENDSKNRILRATQYNVLRNTWKSIRVIMEQSCQELSFHMGTGLLPFYNEELLFLEKKYQIEA